MCQGCQSTLRSASACRRRRLVWLVQSFARALLTTGCGGGRDNRDSFPTYVGGLGRQNLYCTEGVVDIWPCPNRTLDLLISDRLHVPYGVARPYLH